MNRDRYESLQYDGRLFNEIRRIENEKRNLQKKLQEKDKEIEKLNKEIEILKQSQVFIDTQDMEERYAQGLYEDYIEAEEAEYEKLIFDYLTNNCKEFDDEHIKKLVDLKVKQHLSSQKEIKRLNNIINEFEEYLESNHNIYLINNQEFSWGVLAQALDKLKQLKEGK